MLKTPPAASWSAWFSGLPYGAQRRDVDLTGAELISARAPRYVSFKRCRFVGADLRHATLDGASFLLCDFSGADLRGATLRGVHFFGCDLTGADLRAADLRDAVFGSSGTKGSTTRTTLTGIRTDRRAWDVVSEDSEERPDV